MDILKHLNTKIEIYEKELRNYYELPEQIVMEGYSGSLVPDTELIIDLFDNGMITWKPGKNNKNKLWDFYCKKLKITIEILENKNEN